MWTFCSLNVQYYNLLHIFYLILSAPKSCNKLKYSHLVKDLSDVGLRFSKPHGEQLRSFNGDEICLALVGNGFGQQSLTTTRGAIKQHTL